MDKCPYCAEAHEASHLFCPTSGKLIAARLLPEGTLLEGKYRIGRTLGVGGMGAVYEARHTLLDKRMAVKVMLPQLARETEFNFPSRMVREARAASATGHRNIVQVTDMGWTDQGSLYVVMEFLEGRTLKEILEETGCLPVPRTVRLIRQALAGLDAVHREGIVHRDLKPENLMLVDDAGEECVKILDFGIAKRMNTSSDLELTTPGLLIGTPQYMAPEQLQALPEVDRRADIYSAGAILYRALTGSLPHGQESLNQLVAAVLTKPVDPPSFRRPGLPVRLDRVVLKALARKADERYPDARAFSDALRPFAGDEARAGAPGSAENGASRQDAASSPAGVAAAAAAARRFELPPELNADELVHLDEVAAPRAAGAPAHRPATAETVAVSGGADPFAPPEEGDLLAEEREARRARRDTGPRPAGDAAADKAPLAREASSPRVTLPMYGQARRRRARPVFWLCLLGVALLGGYGGWKLMSTVGTPGAGASAEPDSGVWVRIQVDVSPRWAEILVDDAPLASQPLLLPRSSREVRVTVRAAGYAPKTVRVRPEEDRTLFVELGPPGSTEEQKPDAGRKQRRPRRAPKR